MYHDSYDLLIASALPYDDDDYDHGVNDHIHRVLPLIHHHRRCHVHVNGHGYGRDGDRDGAHGDDHGHGGPYGRAHVRDHGVYDVVRDFNVYDPHDVRENDACAFSFFLNDRYLYHAYGRDRWTNVHVLSYGDHENAFSSLFGLLRLPQLTESNH